MPQARDVFSTLISLLSILMLFAGCGGPATQYEILWVEDDQALFRADASVSQGDQVRLHRDVLLKHPIRGDEIGAVHEELGICSVLSIQQELGTLDISELPRIQTDDQFRVEKANSENLPAPIREVGHVVYVTPGDPELVVDISGEIVPSPGQSVVIGIPTALVNGADGNTSMAVKVRLGPQAETKGLFGESQLLLHLSSDADSQQVVLGDPVYLHHGQARETWFELPKARLVEHLLYRRNYERALRQYDSRNYWEAIELLRGLAAAGPLRAQSAYLLGRCYQFIGDYPRAVSFLEESLTASPDAPGTLLVLAHLHTQYGQTSKATQNYQRLLELRPTDPSLWLELGHLYQQTGAVSEAIKAYQHVLEIEPDNEQAQNQITVLQQGQPAAAPLF